MKERHALPSRDIKKTHRKLRSWFDRQKQIGFASSEIETSATYVLNYLYECAYNKEPHHTAVSGLAKHVAELERLTQIGGAR